MGKPESLNPSNILMYFPSHEEVRDAAVNFVNFVGRTQRYDGVFAEIIQTDNPIGTEPKFPFKVNANNHAVSINRTLLLLLPILELERKALSSLDYIKDPMSAFNLKLQAKLKKGKKIERAVVEWVREKRKK